MAGRLAQGGPLGGLRWPGGVPPVLGGTRLHPEADAASGAWGHPQHLDQCLLQGSELLDRFASHRAAAVYVSWSLVLRPIAVVVLANPIEVNLL